MSGTLVPGVCLRETAELRGGSIGRDEPELPCNSIDLYGDGLYLWGVVVGAPLDAAVEITGLELVPPIIGADLRTISLAKLNARYGSCVTSPAMLAPSCSTSSVDLWCIALLTASATTFLSPGT